MHETFDHTADLGLRVRAATLPDLFAEAGQALFAAILDDPSTVRPSHRYECRVDGITPDDLMFDWLRGLLMNFELDGLVFARFRVVLDDSGLAGEMWGEPLDTCRHPLSHEVKAITYHGLRVEPADGGWLAEVIVDI